MEEPEVGLAEALRSFVAERDVPCPACGYNLRGLGGRHCPECGLELRLGVQLGEPAMGALLATLAPLFGVVGAAGAVVAACCWFSVYYGDWPPPAIWVAPVLGLVTGGPFAAALASRPGRIWFRGRSSGARAACAAVAWAGAVGVFLLFMAVLMSF